MARQPVGHTLPSTKETDSLEHLPKSLFVYSPLDFSVDGIRLLVLEPAEDINSLIHCKLQHVTFSQRPKYEALSYTWGSGIVHHSIYIDGKDLKVGQNLFDALRYLRDPLRSRTLWVDAICINQSDVPEKNHQIGIMPFIYMRAKTVLVWLGAPEDGTDQPLKWEETFGKSEKFTFMIQGAKNILYSLCDNPYWKRVWIIQELGLAKKLLVHYGAYTVDWMTFIKKIQSYHDLKESLPVKLQKQLDEKYENSHKLQALIESHQDSLCKEARDHIYGFVGLAVDCQEGFPTDYGKSLYEVWKDVIRFKNAGQSDVLESSFEEPEIDTLRFGRLVLMLLGGPNIVTTDEVARDISPSLEVHQENGSGLEHGEILIPAQIAGKIVHLGPTYHEVMSNLKAMSSWRASINRYLQDNERPSAREESELFLELLEDAEEEDLNIVFPFDREIVCPIPETPECIERVNRDCNLIDADNSALSADSKSISKDPSLFLLGGVFDYGDGSAGKVGLAPANARVGDYVFLIDGIEKAIVVREEAGRVRVVGTAASAENRYLAREVKEGGLKREKRFGTRSFKYKSIHRTDRLDLFVDIATAYQLTS
ncbi:heterokaryon incompatibility protein-domain-containing protein [Bisporella sp. PMI_857]|nr:heterokaryon incompatibility protein-domain-containing protein [Bisporella sp. PMI_857]